MLPASMTRIAITAPGGPEVLAPERVPLPEPGPGEVLIRVAAAGVNYPDLIQRRGRYDAPPGHSTIPGLEVSGEIAAAAPGLPFREGDRVVALCNGGGYAEYVAVPAGQVLPAPRDWDLADAAALPETFFTITQTLVMRAGLAPGMWVLVHGAAGGIGGAAIVVSRILGARPIALASTPERGDYARSLGAVAVILHTAGNFVQQTLEVTGGHGADRIVDVVGGEVFSRNVEAAARHGHIVVVGTLTGSGGGLALNELLGKQLTISGSTLRPQPPATKAAITARLRQDIWPALEAQKPPLRIARLPLAAAPEAHRRLGAREVIGKLVLVTDFGNSLGSGGA